MLRAIHKSSLSFPYNSWWNVRREILCAMVLLRISGYPCSIRTLSSNDLLCSCWKVSCAQISIVAATCLPFLFFRWFLGWKNSSSLVSFGNNIIINILIISIIISIFWAMSSASQLTILKFLRGGWCVGGKDDIMECWRLIGECGYSIVW